MEPLECHSNAVCLLELLPLIQKLVYSSIDRKHFPWSKSQLTLMVSLADHPAMTMKQAASCISSSKEQATRAVAPLVDAGLIERFTDPSNRVHIYIRLTEAGTDYIVQMRGLLEGNVHATITSALNAEEIAALDTSLQTVQALLSRCF